MKLRTALFLQFLVLVFSQGNQNAPRQARKKTVSVSDTIIPPSSTSSGQASSIIRSSSSTARSQTSQSSSQSSNIDSIALFETGMVDIPPSPQTTSDVIGSLDYHNDEAKTLISAEDMGMNENQLLQTNSKTNTLIIIIASASVGAAFLMGSLILVLKLKQAKKRAKSTACEISTTYVQVEESDGTTLSATEFKGLEAILGDQRQLKELEKAISEASVDQDIVINDSPVILETEMKSNQDATPKS